MKIDKKGIIKIIITLLLISIIVFYVDIGKAIDILKEVNLALYFLVFLIFLIGILISSIRWKRLLKVQGLNFPLFTLCCVPTQRGLS